MKSQKVIFGKFRTAFDEELFLVNIVKYENYFALKLIKKPLKKKRDLRSISRKELETCSRISNYPGER